MKARVEVMLREGVLDPQGEAVRHALASLGYDEVRGLRQGKLIEIDLEDGIDPQTARARVAEMCEKLLANTVVETFRIEID